MTKNKVKIGITGGIGSGKSQAIAYLKEKGFHVFSCDEINKTLISDEKYIETLSKSFPDCIEKGKIDKKLLASKIFSSAQKREELNKIAHPIILSKLFSQMEECDETCFAEIPLLLENDLQKYFHKIIILMRKRDSRVQAIMNRDACDVNCALQKIQSQFPYEKAFEEGFFSSDKYILIFNDDSIENLQRQIDDALVNL